MNSYSYTPFRGALSDLAGPELVTLREVSEGWYVDYKKLSPAIKDLARHLSAFANQHGGWLFLGIVEDTSNGMVAGSFPGIPAADVPIALVQLREAASAHVTPPVYFETKIINGPVAEIDLPADRSIVVVGIPESDNTPHVHSSGRIYRRVADQSDPKHETDRHVLDRLWERRVIAKQRLADFLSSASELAESGQSHALVYLLPHRTITAGFSGLTYESFAKLMTAPDTRSHISFTHNNVFPVSGGYISRDTLFNDPIYEVPSFRWWFDGRVRVSIPFNAGVSGQAFANYQTMDRFKKIVSEARLDHRPIVDLSLCLAALTGAVGKYTEIRKLLGWTEPFYGAVQMRGMLRLVPFLNTPFYIDQVERWGIPVIPNDVFSWPPEIDPAWLVELTEPESLPPEKAIIASLLLALPLLVAILRPMGIEVDVLGQEAHGEQIVNGTYEAIQLAQARIGQQL